MATFEKRTLSLYEREHLSKGRDRKLSAFSPRKVQRLAVSGPPKSTTKMECNHLFRTFREDSSFEKPSLEYQIWMEAGKHDPPFPENPDPEYNSNVWRNFKDNFSFYLDNTGRSVTEVIAAIYPINIPKPSKVGQSTFSKYVSENAKLISNSAYRDAVVKRIDEDAKIMEMSQLKSSLRRPPVNEKGNILPPSHYKRFPHYFQPIKDTPTTEYLLRQLKSAPAMPYGYTDKRVIKTPRRLPQWCLKLQESNRHKVKLLEELRKRQNSSLGPTSLHDKTGTPMTSNTSNAASEIDLGMSVY